MGCKPKAQAQKPGFIQLQFRALKMKTEPKLSNWQYKQYHYLQIMKIDCKGLECRVDVEPGSIKVGTTLDKTVLKIASVSEYV